METEQIIKEVIKGKIFIYPTDTIYGIGCNAEDKEAVNKLKEIKQRDKDKPLSVIAPSKEWVLENCIEDAEGLIDKYLPGPYTLLLKKKDPKYLLECSSTELLGVRIPDNEFTKTIQKSRVPFVTTSVNISGEKPITQVSEVTEETREKVDHLIDEGPLTGRPSTLVINGKEISR